VVERRPNDIRPHPMVHYMSKYKLVEEAREKIPMLCPRIRGLIIGFGMSFISTSMPM